MANWFVRKSGSDANAGTSAAAAWLTVNHALSHAGNAASVAGGDTIWIGAGTYREVLALTFNPTSTLNVTADSDGVQTGDAGEVIITAYTTNDKTAPSASPVLTIAAHQFHAFTGITLVGSTANAGCIHAQTSGWHDLTFTRCCLLQAAGGTNSQTFFTDTSAATLNMTFDSCIFMHLGNNAWMQWQLPLNATADKDPAININNCLFIGSSDSTFGAGGLLISQSGGTGTFKPGGLNIRNCTLMGMHDGIKINSGNMSTSIPTTVYNCIVSAGNTGLTGNTTGQMVEDWNIIYCPTARSNVTAGTHSKSDNSYAPLFELGQSLMRGAMARPALSPTIGSPFLGFGNQASSPTVDALGYNRPSGGASASPGIGWLERSNTWGKEVSTVLNGLNAESIVGPGTQDHELPVDAGVSTTISVYLRYDSTYAGTLPQMIVTNGGECGVADATVTHTGAANTWQQVSLTFTPTTSGIVTVRYQSNDTNGAGMAFADSFSVA